MTGVLIFVELALLAVCFAMVTYLKHWVIKFENLISVIDKMSKE